MCEEQQTYLPEPLDDRVVGTVAVLVNRVLPPVIDVHVTQAAHEQLRAGVEMIQESVKMTICGQTGS